jgi:uncharacterized protein (DUF849 family)
LRGDFWCDLFVARCATLFRCVAPSWEAIEVVKACLNGSRSAGDHPAVPVTCEAIAADAAAVRDAGAFAVHVHPRDGDGRQTLAAGWCEATVAAIRRVAPGVAVGFSTSAGIDPDPFARAAALGSWQLRPDFVSVNVSELGWAGIVRAALHAEIAVEVGLATPADAERFSRSSFTHQVLRVIVEVEGGADDARSVAERVPGGVDQIWHGAGPGTWEVLTAAVAAGVDLRVGLEDVLVLPDGRIAPGNASLVAAALKLASS